ncbi:hypothetical protein [Burkholderia territorii]|uniref:hypothetical protein n=1 Tax=Burkholderia territorii TaxID=1503055 RepID=UPI0012D85A52|nr:hypothetical protein [Burkholderia territorii]
MHRPLASSAPSRTAVRSGVTLPVSAGDCARAWTARTASSTNRRLIVHVELIGGVGRGLPDVETAHNVVGTFEKRAESREATRIRHRRRVAVRVRETDKEVDRQAGRRRKKDVQRRQESVGCAGYIG